MKRLNLLALALAMHLPISLSLAQDAEYELVNRQAIDRVWSGNYVGFDLLTEGEHQYIAYYDANRQMTVAHRKGPDTPWNYYKLDSWYGWDSHNYIAMELDRDGHLHVLGNMHAQRVEYFRTTYPHDVRSLKRIDVMENADLERSFTYPRFLKRDNGDLIAKYRSGVSGNGIEVYLAYDTSNKTWQRLHDTPLINGKGLMNAYVEGPTIGPDGQFHMVWIWRDTPDAATNHDICYARSKDLMRWEDASGNQIALPITIETSDIVDPVPAQGGAINGNNKLGFDAQGRPLIAFHKYDARGNTQVYLSRHEAGTWVTRQLTSWEDFRWSFGGTGSLSSFDVRIQNPELLPNGDLRVPIKKLDSRQALILDGDTLELIETQDAFAYPPVISEVASSDKVLINGVDTYGPELILRTLSSKAFTGADDEVYYLSWEAQAPFRGQARDEILAPSTLFLHRLKRIAK